MEQATQSGNDIVKRFVIIDGNRFGRITPMDRATDSETIRIAETLLAASSMHGSADKVVDADDARFIIATMVSISSEYARTMRLRLVMHGIVTAIMAGIVIYRAVVDPIPASSLIVHILLVMAFALVGTYVLVSPFQDMIEELSRSIACVKDDGRYHVGNDDGVLAEVSYVIHTNNDSDDGDAEGHSDSSNEDSADML